MSRRSYGQRILDTLLAALLLSLVPGSALAQAQSRTDTIAYHDNTTKWVLGQVATVTNVETGLVESHTVYNAVTAKPTSEASFGKIKSTYTYHADGTTATVSDGAGNTVNFSSWKRGIPQTITFPATPEASGGTQMSAVVSDAGRIEVVTDPYGYQRKYRYDSMGRIDRVLYPAQDTVAWSPKNVEYKALGSSDSKPSGVFDGQWRRTEEEGGKVAITYYDVFWRPILSQEYDASEPSTKRSTSYRYDFEGRITFTSYPSSSDVPPLKGNWIEYDALGRSKTEASDSELSQPLLIATTSYSSDSNGLYSVRTNPRGKQTKTWYQTFDQPDLSRASRVLSPEGVANWIDRDLFGKPTAIRQSSHSGSSQISRTYKYNSHQELCLTSEPETGSTFYGYDAAGNQAWSAAGYPVGATACRTNAEVAARRVDRTYDTRNRLRTLAFPDGRGNQTWTYALDGLVASIVTYESAYDTSPVVNSYSYNRRRLLLSESIVNASAGATWTVGYGHSQNGYIASLIYPNGQTITYAPNALGQPTQVGQYAAGISYHPNGAVAQFTYGNGVVHSQTLNARQLPLRIRDSRGSAGLVDLTYSYDANGNVTSIVDGINSRQSRTAGYDDLDRLTSSSSPMFGAATYSYDVLDNLVALSVSGGSKARSHHYTYEAGTNRLGNVSIPGGATVIGYGYDAQGNVQNRNGVIYDFDYGNRLRSVAGREVGYAYDGFGRRVRAVSGYTNPRYRRFFYSREGEILFEEETTGQTQSQNMYLGGALLATRKLTLNIPGGSPSVSYHHPDGLNTPIAASNELGQLTNSNEYEPFGRLTNQTQTNRIGFTGHVEDAATGLSYMQQRYYDPEIGVFLSVDPVTAYESGDWRQFNRYAYAGNNPYSFSDPNGELRVAIPVVVFCALSRPCRHAAMGVSAVIAAYFGSRTLTEVRDQAQQNQSSESGEGESGESGGSGESSNGPTDAGGRTPAPFLPDDPYSPESTSRRQSETRESEGTGNLDPDSPIPDRGAGSDQGGHAARGKTPHDTGERNVNRNEEHSRRPKGNPTGRDR